MAGEQSGGRPQQRSDTASGGGAGQQPAQSSPPQPPERPAEALTGGLSGGEWWRVEGPWRVFGAARPEPEEESVYAPAPQVPVEPAPANGEAAGGASAWLIAPATPGPFRVPTVADFPGWDAVTIEFPLDEVEPAEAVADPRLIPDQRAGEEAPAEVEPTGEVGEGALARGLLTGRRPSPLLLLAAAVLLGGAVSGLILVLLAGWGLAYLSARLGDLMKKFVVFGIPLLTMSGSSIWFWGRAQGRWGEPLAKGSPATHAAFAAAPGVLRVAAVVSALVLLAVALRRRRA
ncbi:hypothetical protein [Kitasatospora azatica]|uniref:hypothetical protein n=1 Tax=Kitasatospora azatica TaxID=58347 RepID=UPI00068F3031|nr:hypothetical protein [Kitasatospora azatica]